MEIYEIENPFWLSDIFIFEYIDDDGVFTQMGDIFFKSLMKVGNALMYQETE